MPVYTCICQSNAVAACISLCCSHERVTHKHSEAQISSPAKVWGEFFALDGSVHLAVRALRLYQSAQTSFLMAYWHCIFVFKTSYCWCLCCYGNRPKMGSTNLHSAIFSPISVMHIATELSQHRLPFWGSYWWIAATRLSWHWHWFQP